MKDFDLRKYLAEGKLLNEATNLNDTLDTPEDLIKFITGGETGD